MHIPIHRTYDYTKPPIGMVFVKDSQLKFRFSQQAKVTKDEIFQIFGNIGFMAEIIETESHSEDVYIIEGTILTWVVNNARLV